MKKPIGYNGFAWDSFCEGYNKNYCKSKKAKKEKKKYKKRMKTNQEHYAKYGWDSTETWNLDNTFAKFVLPRLKYFKDNLHGYPGSLQNTKEWKKILNKIIWSFEYVINDYNSDSNMEKQKIEWKKYQKGMKLFGKYYSNLWD